MKVWGAVSTPTTEIIEITERNPSVLTSVHSVVSVNLIHDA